MTLIEKYILFVIVLVLLKISFAFISISEDILSLETMIAICTVAGIYVAIKGMWEKP